jgi:protein TonB
MPLPTRTERVLPKPAKHAVRDEPSRKLAAPTPAPPKPVLALREPANAESAFSVPQSVPEPPAVATPEPPSGIGALPSAPRESVATTAANFNAAYLRNAPPRSPLIARRNGVEGTVKLRVLVTRDGRAAQVELAQTSGSSALDNAALQAVREWQFVPARRGQDATESWVVVPVVFKLENTG